MVWTRRGLHAESPSTPLGIEGLENEETLDAAVRHQGSPVKTSSLVGGPTRASGPQVASVDNQPARWSIRRRLTPDVIVAAATRVRRVISGDRSGSRGSSTARIRGKGSQRFSCGRAIRSRRDLSVPRCSPAERRCGRAGRGGGEPVQGSGASTGPSGHARAHGRGRRGPRPVGVPTTVPLPAVPADHLAATWAPHTGIQRPERAAISLRGRGARRLGDRRQEISASMRLSIATRGMERGRDRSFPGRIGRWAAPAPPGAISEDTGVSDLSSLCLDSHPVSSRVPPAPPLVETCPALHPSWREETAEVAALKARSPGPGGLCGAAG
jgi:hypothetical protein